MNHNQPGPIGRPTTYTQELADSLLLWMADGGTVKMWCKNNNVGMTTVAQWRYSDESFAKLYAEAREMQGDALADEAMAAALDMEIPSDHKRILVDTRKWFASKMRPKVYGERTQLEHSGSIAPTADPQAIADQLVTMANSHPTYRPTLVQWASDLLKRLQEAAP